MVLVTEEERGRLRLCKCGLIGLQGHAPPRGECWQQRQCSPTGRASISDCSLATFA